MDNLLLWFIAGMCIINVVLIGALTTLLKHLLKELSEHLDD